MPAMLCAGFEFTKSEICTIGRKVVGNLRMPFPAGRRGGSFRESAPLTALDKIRKSARVLVRFAVPALLCERGLRLSLIHI